MPHDFRTDRRTRKVHPLRGGMVTLGHMDRAQTRVDAKRMELVNVYRTVWGSNAGLSTERLLSMSERELDESIRSLRRMLEGPMQGRGAIADLP